MPHALSPDRDVPTCNDEKLFVNDGLLRPGQVGQLIESSTDLPIDELLRRYNEDGYVYPKSLLLRADVLKAREEYFKMLSSRIPSDFPGIGAGAAGGNGKPGASTAENFVDLALEAHYASWYKETFCKHPVLKDFISRMTGWGDNILAVRRSLLRNNTPGNKAIGVHYDQIFLRHGEPTSVTAWIPMGDVSLTGGGLIYLENGELFTQQGHTLGREVEAGFTRKARERGLNDEETKNAFNQNMLSTGLLADGPREYSDTFNRRWQRSTKLAMSSSILRLRDNVIRVGTDLRFGDASKPWDKRWDHDYRFNDGV
ncbi:Nn.00g078670.m01.CDS01 [Neocucurbitaria sp. VM-36]